MKGQADFRAAVNNIDPDIIMGCESKIDSSIASYSVFPQNYNIIRKDRDKNGGGVFLAIKNSLIVSELPGLDFNSEIVWANLHFANAKSIYLASYYRTPNAGPASLEDLNVSLSSLFSKHPRQVPNLVIGGDFNLGDIDWETWTPTIKRTRSIHDKFLQLLIEHSLVQLNRHITRPASKKCFDYVVTSNQNLVSNIEVFPGISDHLIVAFNIDMKPHHSVKPQRKILVFKKANNDLLKENVSRFSAEFLSSNPQENSVNENWLTIKQTLTALMHEHVPSKLSRTRHHLPWIDFTLKRQMRRRDRMFSKARKTNGLLTGLFVTKLPKRSTGPTRSILMKLLKDPSRITPRPFGLMCVL